MFMDELGEISWEYAAFPGAGIIADILLIDDNTFYLIGKENTVCDCCGEGFIYKFNIDGELLFQSTSEDQVIIPIDADLFPNKDLILAGQRGLFDTF